MANDPREILESALRRAIESKDKPLIDNPEIVQRIEFLARLTSNRAGARLIMSCALAKVHKPDVDIRKPYTEIGPPDSYSGRSVYDEQYVANFIQDYELPLNSTTPWLTPGFRVRNATLTLDLHMVGRPKGMYVTVLQLLDDVFQSRVSAEDLLAEMIRWLLIVKEERRQRMESLLAVLESSKGETSLSAKEIVGLIEHHLEQKNSSRLPVLVVAAAYQAAQDCLGEQVLPLESHNAADKQTGSLGDLEITLVDDTEVVTSYEMKQKRVDKLDIDHAITKFADSKKTIDNYIFITTYPIDPEVNDYASTMFDKAGVEVTILDCITFLQYFLSLFYRLRISFLEAYQELVLSEPDSAVSPALKEVFLSLRQAAESGASN